MFKKEENDIVTNVRNKKLAERKSENLLSNNANNDEDTKRPPSQPLKSNIHHNIEKHIKDNSFKLNNSLTKTDLLKRKQKLIEMKDTARTLQLKVINANSPIKKGTVLTINCFGLENGNNNRNDGFVYFGYIPHNMSIPLDEDNNNVIDFNLDMAPSAEVNQVSENESTNNVGRHFLIEYLLDKNKFIIKDMGIGYGTFVRLNYIHTLKDNQLINIGQIYIVVNIGEKAEENNNSHFNSYSQNNNSIASSKVNQLKLRVYGVNHNGDTFYFMPQNHNISIGRYELADVKLNDKLLSQIHCVINYSEKEGWKLMDGQRNKPSTNGTWIYINEEYEIYDKMIFKTNQTIFQASIIEHKPITN